MPRERFIIAIVGALCAATVLSSCDVLQTALAPCPRKDSTDAQLMDGPWYLKTIDGKPIPADGYKIPTTDKYLMRGAAWFTTTDTQQDDECGKVLQSSGYIDFMYDIKKGSAVNSSMYPGRFRRDHEDNATSIGADKYTVPVVVSGSPRPNKMVVTAEIGAFAISVTYVLEFQRTTP